MVGERGVQYRGRVFGPAGDGLPKIKGPNLSLNARKGPFMAFGERRLG